MELRRGAVSQSQEQLLLASLSLLAAVVIVNAINVLLGRLLESLELIQVLCFHLNLVQLVQLQILALAASDLQLLNVRQLLGDAANLALLIADVLAIGMTLSIRIRWLIGSVIWLVLLSGSMLRLPLLCSHENGRLACNRSSLIDHLSRGRIRIATIYNVHILPSASLFVLVIPLVSVDTTCR